MFDSPLRRLVPSVVILLSLGCLVPLATRAREDVPDEIARKQNPVTLTDARVRYFKRQYRAKCARCHGATGDGGGEEAKEQPVPPRDLTDAEYMSSRSDGQLFYQILVGGGDRCAMPAFGPESDHAWNEEKIWGMVAYVRRFAQPPEK